MTTQNNEHISNKEVDQKLTEIIKQCATSFDYSPPKDISPEGIKTISLWMKSSEEELRSIGVPIPQDGLSLPKIEERTREVFNEDLQDHILEKKFSADVRYPEKCGKVDYELFVGIEHVESEQQTLDQLRVNVVGSVRIILRKSRTNSIKDATRYAVGAVRRLRHYTMRLNEYGFSISDGERLEKVFSKDNQTIEELIQTLHFLDKFPNS